MSNDLLQKDLGKIYSECFKDKDLGHLFFLGVLAYPGLKDKNHVMNFIFSVLSEKSKALAEYFHERYFIDKRLKGFEARKAKRNIEHVFNKRIPRRMQAVLIALNVINKWESNISNSVVHIDDLLNDKLEEATSNVYRLIWTESKSVLHMAMALFPFIHHIISDDEEPSILSLSFLDELNQKGVKKRFNMEIFEFPIRDIFILSHSVKKRLSIKDTEDIIANYKWLPDILKIAEAWSFILPKLIPTIKKEDLFLI